MNELLMLAAAPGFLWLFLLFIRMPAITFTLSILVGKLFAEILAGSVYDIANNFITIGDEKQVQMFLLLLPVALSVILARSQVGPSKMLVNGILLLLASLTLELFALPYTDFLGKFSADTQDIIMTYQNYVIAATGVLALLLAWTSGLKHGRRKHR
jgi:hypothetical protein